MQSSVAGLRLCMRLLLPRRATAGATASVASTSTSARTIVSGGGQALLFLSASKWLSPRACASVSTVTSASSPSSPSSSTLRLCGHDRWGSSSVTAESASPSPSEFSSHFFSSATSAAVAFRRTLLHPNAMWQRHGFATHRDWGFGKRGSGGGWGSKGSRSGGGGWRPFRNSRWLRQLEDVDPNRLVMVMIGVNVAVFALWKLAESRLSSAGDPGMLRFLRNHFVASWVNVSEGRVWTLVTSSFSHDSPMHLFVNMFVLYNFGAAVVDMLGTRRFLLFYFATAILSAGIFTIHSRLTAPPPPSRPAFDPWFRQMITTARDHYARLPGLVGASGSLTAMMALFALVHPTAQVLLWGIVPLPAAAIVLMQVAGDVYAILFPSPGNRTSNLSHLVGAGLGAGYYFFLL